MARYFQHLNSHDANFQSVTELDYIDQSDPTFVLYHFKDGTKCSKQFIAKINEGNVYGKYELAEVSSPKNKWQFKVEAPIEADDHKPRFITNPDTGETFEIPSEDVYMQNKKPRKPLVSVLRKPMFVNIDPEQEEAPVLLESRLAKPAKALTSDTPTINATISEIETIAQEQVMSQMNMPTQVTAQPQTRTQIVTKEPSVIDFIQKIEDFYNDTTVYAFSINGTVYHKSFHDIIDAAIKPVEPQIVEKEVVKEIVKDSNIPVKINDSQKMLVDNMIDMAVKDTCDIDMSLTLKLPSVNVYDVLKKNYPKELADGFVNIIANRMQIKDLKQAVAAGLHAYYDGDVEQDAAPVEKTAPVIDASLNMVQISNKTKAKRKSVKSKDK